MPNTTNYGWPTPSDADYVANGALAIRNLGNAADATVKSVRDAQPFAFAAGKVGGYSTGATVTFPSGRFSVAPIVTVAIEGDASTAYITNLTATGFTAYGSAGQYFHWIAVQMTSSSAAG